MIGRSSHSASSFSAGTSPWRNANFQNLASRFSTEIRADANLMLMLVKKCGLCIRHVDDSPKGNLEIARAACDETSLALFHSGPEAQRALLHDKAFLLKTLDRFQCSHPHSKMLHEAPPVTMQRDRELVDVMLSKGYFAVDTCRAAGLTGRDFWLSTCRQNLLNSSLWLQLPAEFRTDDEFMVLFRFESVEVVEHLLRDCPLCAGN